MRVLILMLVLLGFSLPAAAQGIEDGRYILGKQIWDRDMVTPRYIELEVVDGTVSATYTSFFQPDASMCKRWGHCEQRVTPLRFKLAVAEGGQISATEVERIEGKVTRDPPVENEPELQEKFFIKPLLGRFENARVTLTETGFELSNRNGFTPFFKAGPDDTLRIVAWVSMVEESISRMNGCEVQGLMPIFQNADATAGHKLFISALDGMTNLNKIRWEADRLIDYIEGFDEEATRKIRDRAIPAQMVFVIPSIRPELDLTDDDAVAEALLDLISKKNPETRPMWAENLEPFMPHLSAMAQIGVAAKLRREDIQGHGRDPIRELCRDPSFGLIAN